jgi:hypothetical protein
VKNPGASEIISIKSEIQPEKRQNDTTDEPHQEKPAEPVSPENLIKVWKMLSEKFKTNKNLYHTLTNKTPEVTRESFDCFCSG